MARNFCGSRFSGTQNLDVVGFGVLALATVFLSQIASKRFEISLWIPSSPFEVSAAVLGLLLVLRLNAGYERWREARKLWGGIVNQSRNLAIAGLSYGPMDQQWREQFIEWVAAFPHVTRRSLRDQRQLPELARLLSESQLVWLIENIHYPDAVSRRIATLLSEGRAAGMNGFAFQEAEKQRALLVDHVGGCERILKTPLARSGAIQVRQFIFILLAALPFTLLHDFEGTVIGTLLGSNESNRVWLVPLFIMLLAYMLLAMDSIGMELQNPFDVRRVDYLPLDGICKTIEQNLLERLHDDDFANYSALKVDEVELPPDAVEHISNDELPADIA